MNAKEFRAFQIEVQNTDQEYRNKNAVSNADSVVEKLKNFMKSDNYKYAISLQVTESIFGDNIHDRQKTIIELEHRGFKIEKVQHTYTGSQYDDYWGNKDKLDYRISWW